MLTFTNANLYPTSRFINLKPNLTKKLFFCQLQRMSICRHPKRCALKYMAAKLCKLHKVKFSKSQTLIVNSYIPSVILSVGFAIPCAICTKMELSTSLVLTPKRFVIYGVMKEFFVLESKRQHTFLSLLTQFTSINWTFHPRRLPWFSSPLSRIFQPWVETSII